MIYDLKSVIYLIDLSGNDKEGMIVPLDDISAIKFKYTDHPKNGTRSENVTIFLKNQNKQISWDGSDKTLYRIIVEGAAVTETRIMKEFELSYAEAVSGYVPKSGTVSPDDNPSDGTSILSE